jgi:hypothetical protein
MDLATGAVCAEGGCTGTATRKSYRLNHEWIRNISRTRLRGEETVGGCKCVCEYEYMCVRLVDVDGGLGGYRNRKQI